MRNPRIGEITIPIVFDQLVELVNEKRRLRKEPLLPEDMTQDNLRINFNSEEYNTDLINMAFLGHLQYDVLIPYPGNAWMQSVLPSDAFTEVYSTNYFQKINGDCELTHAMEDLYRIVKPGGTAYIVVPNCDLILQKLVGIKEDTGRLKWEHFLFSRNVDEKGLFYNQSLCSARRLKNRARFAGFQEAAEDKEYGESNIKYLDMVPEEYNLPGVNEKARKQFRSMISDSSIRRKKCIVPRCQAKAGQQEFRRMQSIYCRRHYRKAKAKLTEAQERALRIMVILKKE